LIFSFSAESNSQSIPATSQSAMAPPVLQPPHQPSNTSPAAATANAFAAEFSGRMQTARTNKQKEREQDLRTQKQVQQSGQRYINYTLQLMVPAGKNWKPVVGVGRRMGVWSADKPLLGMFPEVSLLFPC
jgi:hypothetical protein